MTLATAKVNAQQEAKEQLKAQMANLDLEFEIREALKLNEKNELNPWSAWADRSVELTAPTLEAGLRKAKRMKPIKLFKVKGACLSYLPETYHKLKSEMENSEVTPIKPIFYNIDDKKVLHFYVKAGKYTVEVRLKIENDPNTSRTFKPVYERGSCACILSSETTLSFRVKDFETFDKFYSSTEYPNHFVLYNRLKKEKRITTGSGK